MLLTELTSGREDEILDTVSVIDGVLYRDGYPAPVYAKYQEEMEEYYYFIEQSEDADDWVMPWE